MRIVVLIAAGGVSDVAAREVANDLGKAFGQSVVVENKSGEQAIMVLTPSSVAGVNRHLRKSFPFSALDDFAPVDMIVETTKIQVNALPHKGKVPLLTGLLGGAPSSACS